MSIAQKREMLKFMSPTSRLLHTKEIDEAKKLKDGPKEVRVLIPEDE